MTDFNEDQEIVLSIIKEWLRDGDKSFLAREDLVVFWGPIDGNLKKQGWNKLKLKEAVSIIRATKVPVGLMKHCSEDLLRAAAQEEERTYICGVTVISGMVSPGYFNFHSQKRSCCEVIEHRIAIHLISELEALDQNIMWKDLRISLNRPLNTWVCKYRTRISVTDSSGTGCKNRTSKRSVTTSLTTDVTRSVSMGSCVR